MQRGPRKVSWGILVTTEGGRGSLGAVAGLLGKEALLLEDGVIERKSVLGSRNSLCKEPGKSEDWKEGQSHLTGVRTRTIAREICEIIERLMK